MPTLPPDRPTQTSPSIRWAVAWAVLLPAAALLGAALGLAGRILLVFGLYDVAAALLLGALAVAVLHLLSLAPGRMRWPLAVGLTVAQAAALLVADAWGAWHDQVRWVQDYPEASAEDLLVAGVDTPEALVDLGLQAAVGQGGPTGAWLQQWRAGVLIHRGLEHQRVWPLPTPLHAAVLGVELAFVALLIGRSLANLGHEPRCQRCGQYLRRQLVARVSAPQAEQLAQAWAEGRYAEPDGDSQPAVAQLYRDTCTLGHTQRPGLALLGLRRRGLSQRHPGPWAILPPMLDPPPAA